MRALIKAFKWITCRTFAVLLLCLLVSPITFAGQMGGQLSPATPAIISTIGNSFTVSVAVSTTYVGAPNGGAAAVANTDVFICPYAGTLSNLWARGLSGGTGPPILAVTILKNGTSSGLGVNIAGTTDTTSTNSSTTVSVAAGDRITFQLTQSAGGPGSFKGMTMQYQHN